MAIAVLAALPTKVTLLNHQKLILPRTAGWVYFSSPFSGHVEIIFITVDILSRQKGVQYFWPATPHSLCPSIDKRTGVSTGYASMLRCASNDYILC